MAKWVVRSVATAMPELRWARESKSLTKADWVKRRPWVSPGASGKAGEGGDAGGAGEEGGAEVRYGIADGGDAAQSGDDDTIHFFSLMVRLRLKVPVGSLLASGCEVGVPPPGWVV